MTNVLNFMIEKCHRNSVWQCKIPADKQELTDCIRLLKVQLPSYSCHLEHCQDLLCWLSSGESSNKNISMWILYILQLFVRVWPTGVMRWKILSCATIKVIIMIITTFKFIGWSALIISAKICGRFSP